MRFNPRNVIILLFAVFSALNFPESPITSEELIIEEKLESSDYYYYYFFKIDQLIFDNWENGLPYFTYVVAVISV